MEKDLKKIHQIGIRVNDEVFETLLSIATKQRWTVSATANYIKECSFFDSESKKECFQVGKGKPLSYSQQNGSAGNGEKFFDLSDSHIR